MSYQDWRTEPAWYIDLLLDHKAVGDAQRSLGKLEKSADRSSNRAGSRRQGVPGVGVAATGMSGFGIGLTKQFLDSQKVSKQTDAVLKSTGGAANVTAKQVSDLATAISRKTGIDDEAIQSSRTCC
jgi:hypothetical protein